MPTPFTLEQLRTAKDVAIEPTAWFEISQDRVNAFADATDDHQWIHVDPVRAAAGPFGRTIVHGYLTLSLMPKFVWEAIELSDTGLLVNYGVDKLRYPAPVPVGSRVRLKPRLIGGADKQGGVLFHVGATVEVEGQAKPGLAAELLYLAFPRT